MLRTNLSTRPFYNERLVQALLAVAALLVIGLTALNAYQVWTLSTRFGERTGRAQTDEARARALRAEATKLRTSINPDDLKAVVAAAEEANAIIDRRTFSWTALFNQIEDTVPSDVMLVSVQPQIEKGRITVGMVVVGKSVEAIDTFMEHLEATKHFTDVLSLEEVVEDDGTYKASLTGEYLPAAAEAKGN